MAHTKALALTKYIHIETNRRNCNLLICIRLTAIFYACTVFMGHIAYGICNLFGQFANLHYIEYVYIDVTMKKYEMAYPDTECLSKLLDVFRMPLHGFLASGEPCTLPAILFSQLILFRKSFASSIYHQSATAYLSQLDAGKLSIFTPFDVFSQHTNCE